MCECSVVSPWAVEGWPVLIHWWRRWCFSQQAAFWVTRNQKWHLNKVCLWLENKYLSIYTKAMNSLCIFCHTKWNPRFNYAFVCASHPLCQHGEGQGNEALALEEEEPLHPLTGSPSDLDYSWTGKDEDRKQKAIQWNQWLDCLEQRATSVTFSRFSYLINVADNFRILWEWIIISHNQTLKKKRKFDTQWLRGKCK